MPLFVRDDHYKKTGRWHVLDETRLQAEIDANQRLEAKLARGPVSPRTLRNAVLHRCTDAPVVVAQPPRRRRPVLPPAYDEDSSDAESYDASAYSDARHDWTPPPAARDRDSSASSNDDESASDDNVAAVARARLEALENDVAAMRRVLTPPDDQSLAPTYDDEAQAAPVNASSPAPTPRSALYADAERRAAERRRCYRRERAAVRERQAECELAELQQRRRALSAPGPFVGLMRREEAMAQRKRQHVQRHVDANLKARAEASFKFKKPPTPRPQRKATDAATHNRPNRAAAKLAESDTKAPRVAHLATKATRARAIHKESMPRREPTPKHHNKAARTSAIDRKARTTKARLLSQRARFDAYVDFHRRPNDVVPPPPPEDAAATPAGGSSCTSPPPPPTLSPSAVTT